MTANAWLQSGLTEVLLPSGYRVRGKLPTVQMLLQRGVFPAHLLEVAVKLADPDWLQDPDDFEERAAKAQEYLEFMVVNFPSEVWDDEAGWERITEPILIEHLADDDVDAIERVILRLWTPEKATAMAEYALGLRDDAAEEGGLPDWATFRLERRRREAGDGREDMGPATEPDDGADRPRRRARARRGAGDAAGGRGDAGGDAGSGPSADPEPAGSAAPEGDALRDGSGPREVVAA